MNAFVPLQSQTPARQGWRADLSILFRHVPGKTVLGDCRRVGPLTVQKPFYPEGEVCHLYLLHPPGGLVGGDELQLAVNLEADAHALMTTPGATKFYRSAGSIASQHQRFCVRENATFEWLPQETIFFPDAYADISTQVDLAEKAVFIGWEILCLGLPCNRQDFASGRLTNALRVNRQGRPLFIDRLCLSELRDLAGPAGLRGQPVVGTFVASGVLPDSVAEFQQSFGSGEPLLGLTLIDDLLIGRYLGGSSQEASQIFQHLWQRLRPELVGRTASPPRIWAT